MTETPALPEELRSAAERVFGDRLDLAVRFAEHLATTGVERGLIGPREGERIWERHVLNCAVVEELVPRAPDGGRTSVADVGSGAGLPGIALAIARPDLAVTLIEPMERRTEWMAMVVADLGLDAEVLRARAEEIHGDRTFGVVAARAVAALDRLARWTVPLVRPGGAVLALKGASAEADIEKATKALRKLRVADVRIETCGGEALERPTRVVRMTVAGRGPEHRGRREGN